MTVGVPIRAAIYEEDMQVMNLRKQMNGHR